MDQGQFYTAIGILWVFGLIVLSVVGWHLKSKRHMENVRILHAERMRAMEKGLPLPEFPDLSELDDHARRRAINPRWPLGVGALLVMGGIGTFLTLNIAPGFADLAAFGFLPIFLGIGMFLFYFLTKSPSAKL